jgi:hypothetical protein
MPEIRPATAARHNHLHYPADPASQIPWPCR